MLICGLISLLFLSVNSQSVRLLSSTELLSEVNKQNDTLYVLNFWATWCKPCIEELPWFETAGKKYKDNTVKILLINLDFNSKVNNQVIPFVRKKELKSEILHLTDTDPNQWINKIDSAWSGAIPATVLMKNGKVTFFKEGQVNEKELHVEIDKQIQKTD